MDVDLSLAPLKVLFRNPTTTKEEKWCKKCGKMTVHISLSMVDHQNLLNEQAGMKRCGILEKFFYNIGDRLRITWALEGVHFQCRDCGSAFQN
jgi:hypothetical protein